MTLKKYDYIKYIHIFCKSDDKLWNLKVTAHVVACVCASDLHHILAGRPNGRTGAAGGWHWGCPADSPQYVAAQWSGRHSDWCRGHSGNKGRSAGPSGGGDTSDAVKSLPQRRCISVNEPVSRWNPSRADRLVKCCCFCFVFFSPIWLWLVAERSGTCCSRRLSWWSWSPASLCLSAPGGRASALQPECPLSACRWSPWFSAKQEHTWNHLKWHCIYCISKAVAQPRICISFPPFQLTSAPSRQVA